MLKKGRQSKAGRKNKHRREEGEIENAVGNFAVDVNHLEVYDPVYIGSDTKYTFSCEPGKSYQFRVQAFNSVHAETEARAKKTAEAVGIMGAKSFSRLSEPCVVHADNSATVDLRPVSVRSSSITIAWNSVAIKKKLPHKQNWTEVVNAWAQATADFGSVNSATVRKVFMKYDEDCSGFLESSELRKLLRDLGIQPDSLIFDRAVEALDTDGNGRVDLEEFTRWYSDDSAPVEYIVTCVEKKAKEDRDVNPRPDCISWL